MFVKNLPLFSIFNSTFATSIEANIMKKHNILFHISLSAALILVAVCNYSCANKQADSNTIEYRDTTSEESYHTDATDSILAPEPQKLYNDTTITYDIPDMSSEGAGAAVKYVQGKISHAEIRIYGGMGQSKTDYTFTEEGIEVTDTVYQYTKSITEVRSLTEDAYIESANKYTLAYDGRKIKPQADTIPDELFAIFRQNVPFTLYAE